MLYSHARQQIKSGDLLAWSGGGWLSRLIRRVTMSAYSHVGIAWVNDGGVFVLEAREGRGVTIRRLSHALPFYWVALNLPWTTEADTFAWEEMQKKYSYLDALLAGLGIRMKNSNRWICSEYSREIIRLCGVPVPDDVQTPAQLIAYMHTLDYAPKHVRLDDVSTE